MIPQAIWGLYASPSKTWQTLANTPPAFKKVIITLCFIAAIPAISAFYAAHTIGWHSWNYGNLKTSYLATHSAFIFALALYIALVGSVFLIAALAQPLLKLFLETDAPKKQTAVSYQNLLTLLSFAAMPLYMAGIGALYAELWFIALFFMIGLAYSLYLLYSGTEILFNFKQEQAFFYASSILTIALIVLVALVILTIVIWMNGFGPQFISQ